MDYVDIVADARRIHTLAFVDTGKYVNLGAEIRQGAGDLADVYVHAAGLALSGSSQRTSVISQEGYPVAEMAVHVAAPSPVRSRLMRKRW